MDREIALDTETTGFEPKDGHRIVEIGCVEMINRVPTGNNFHVYINPERDMPEGAFKVHGLSEEFLSDKPKFAEVAKDFNNFIGNSKLIIHNADFDVKFLNAELFAAKLPEIKNENVFCTLKFARRKFPGAANNLDALCRRFEIENSHRTLHGALLDSEILAEVYLELMGGKQVNIDLGQKANDNNNDEVEEHKIQIVKRDFAKRDFPPNKEEISIHNELIESIENSIWKKYT